MQLEILYEDNHLFVVNKLAGILTQPSGTEQINMEDICKEYIKIKANKPGNVFLSAVHRIDKPVSGIVMFAKTSKALSRMNASMRSKEFKKIYYAIVEGTFQKKSGTLEHFLFHDDYKAVVVKRDAPNAKLCRLHYSTLKVKEPYSLVEIDLETGRYHQIRAQLSASFHPIVGDLKYNSKTPYQQHCIALHHAKLQFPHPITKEVVSIEAKWNSDLFIKLFCYSRLNFK